MPDKPSSRISTADTPSPDAPGAGTSPDEPNNAASDGYWIHDDLGPKHYVGPDAAAAGARGTAAGLAERIGAAWRRKGIDAGRMHVSVGDETIVIEGVTGSEAERDAAAETVAQLAPGLRVANRLVLRTGLGVQGDRR